MLLFVDLIFVVAFVYGIIMIAFYFEFFKNRMDQLIKRQRTFLYFLFHIIYVVGCLGSFSTLSTSETEVEGVNQVEGVLLYLVGLGPYVIYTLVACIVFTIYMDIQRKREKKRIINGKYIVVKNPVVHDLAVVVTVLAIGLFIYFEYNLFNDPITKSEKIGAHLMNFFFCFTIPIILWIASSISQENMIQNQIAKNQEQPKPQKVKSKPKKVKTKLQNELKVDDEVRSEARKRLREAKSDFEEGFLTQEEYQKILDDNKPKIL